MLPTRLMLVVLAVGMAGGWYFVWEYARREAVPDSAMTIISAEVRDAWTSRDSGSSRKTYHHIRYRFPVGTKHYTADAKVSEALAKNLPIGAAVSIRFAPDDPKNSRPVFESHSAGTATALRILAYGLGLGSVAVLLIALFGTV